jgi:hypothetical protein
VLVARSCAERFGIGEESYALAVQHFAQLAGLSRGRLRQEARELVSTAAVPDGVRADLEDAMEGTSV